MFDELHLEIVQSLIDHKVPGVKDNSTWDGIPHYTYNNYTALTTNIVSFPKEKLDGRPKRFEVADHLCQKLKSVGLTFQECDELSFYYSFFRANLPSRSVNLIPRLNHLLNYLDSRLVTQSTINFIEPQRQIEADSSASSLKSLEDLVYRDYTHRFKLAESSYSPSESSPAASFSINPKEKRRSLPQAPSVKPRTRRQSSRVLEEENVLESITLETDFEETVSRGIKHIRSLGESSIADHFAAANSPQLGATSRDLFHTARVEDLNFEEDFASPLLPLAESTGSDSILHIVKDLDTSFEFLAPDSGMSLKQGKSGQPSSKKMKKNPVAEGEGEEVEDMEQEEYEEEEEVAGEEVEQPLQQGNPGSPGGGGSSHGSDDEGGGGADGDGGKDPGKRDNKVPDNGNKDSEATLRAALVELKQFVTREEVHSVLVPLESFADLTDGDQNVHATDLDLRIVKVTNENLVVEFEYADKGQVVRTLNPSAKAPLPRSNTRFLYSDSVSLFAIPPEDYAVYWCIAFTLNGEIGPTRNMIIILASYQRGIKEGKKIIKEELGELMVDHSTVRLVTTGIITTPYGSGDAVINEFYLKKVSSGWDLLDKNIQKMREGCRFAGFDLDLTIITALTKYRNGEGIVTKIECRTFMLDLKIVALVTYIRGYSLDKVFTKWEDQAVLEKFKTICVRLGIKSTRSESAAKDELTLSRVPMLVPYAQPKFCLNDPEPGVIQLKKLPKATHCGSFCGLVPNLPEWEGVYMAGICYLIYQDIVINKKAKKQQRVSQIMAFQEVARNAHTAMSMKQKILRMRMLLVSAEIQAAFLVIVPSMVNLGDDTTKHATGVISALLTNFPDLWE